MDEPKRKYTVTAKVLAANRANLVKAREVNPGYRFRVNGKRLAACRANIRKALAVQRAVSLTPDGYPRKLEAGKWKLENGNSKLENGDSAIVNPQSAIVNPPSAFVHPRWPDAPGYGTCFTRGLYAASLRRSARLAGETPEGFDAHVAQFLEVLGPRTERERRLARGLAETVWRRLRVYRGQARWEQACLIRRLSEAARGPSPQEWEYLSPQNLALGLRSEIMRILSTDERLAEAEEKLNRRLERLSRLWFEERGGEGDTVAILSPPGVRDARLAGRSPAAMGNPMLAPGRVQMRLERGEALAPHSGPGARDHAGSDLEFWVHHSDRALRYGVLRAAWLAPDGETRNSKLEIGNSAGGNENPTSSSDFRVSNFDFRKSPAAWAELLDRAFRGITHPEDASLQDALLEDSGLQARVAECLWQCAQVYQEHARHEAGETASLLAEMRAGKVYPDAAHRMFAAIFGGGSQPGESAPPRRRGKTRDQTSLFLSDLLGIFHHARSVGVIKIQSVELLHRAFHAFFESRWGQPESLEDVEGRYKQAMKESDESIRKKCPPGKAPDEAHAPPAPEKKE